jgi:hypothetical protein
MGSDRVIRPRVRQAIAAAIDLGVTVTIATGRMYASTLPFAASLGIRAPLVCYQGGYVREMPRPDGSAGRVLLHRPLDPETARDAVTWARGLGFDPHVNVDDRLMMEIGDESAEDYERGSGIGAEFVPDLIASIAGPVTKVLAVGAAPLPERALAGAREAFGGRAQVTVSHPDYLEWTAAGVTKARGVGWLARRLGIPLRDTMAIGDQYNDAELIAEVGHGVAMGGAPESVKAAARHVTGRLEEDGAAVAIEGFVLQGRAA